LSFVIPAKAGIQRDMKNKHNPSGFRIKCGMTTETLCKLQGINKLKKGKKMVFQIKYYDI